MQKFKMVNHSKIIELLDMKYWGFWLTMFYIMVLPTGILAEVGVEPRKIVLGTHQPLSGPMKNYAQIGRGASIYFQYLNDQGGIHGRLLFLLQRDDRFKPQRTLKLVEELVMKDRVFALFSGIGTETSESAMPLLKSQGVPHFFIGSNARRITEPPRHGIFSMLPTPEVEARVLGQYVNSNHPGEKVILWFRDEPEYKAASKEIAQKLQGNPLQFLPSKAGSSQFKAEWEAIRAGNPRAVIALGPYAPLIKFLRAADVSGTPIYTGNALADSSLWRMLDSRIINRLRVLTSFPLLIESNHPGIRLHRALLREYAPDFKPGRWSIYGHSVAELMAEVLRRSGRDLTREGAIRSAENLKSWRGKLMPPVYLDRNQHLSMSFLRVSRIMPTKVVHLSEWLDGR